MSLPTLCEPMISRKLSSTLLALAMMGSGIGSALADVSGSCVEGTATCTCPDGRVVSVSCNQQCTPALCGTASPGRSQSSSGGSTGFTPVQNAELNGAYNVGQAIGTAFINWLFSPTPDHSAQIAQQQQQALLAQQQEQARIAEERRQRELARIQFQQARDQTIANLKGSAPDQALAPKDDVPDQPLTLKNPDTEQTLTSLKNQVRTIECALGEVYQAADALGHDGMEYSNDVSKQAMAAYKHLPEIPQDGAKNTYDVIDFSDDSMKSVHNAQSNKPLDTQLVTRVLVSREGETGNTHIIVDHSVYKDGKKISEGQSTAILNSLGDVECQDVTSATAKCMSQFNPASSNVRNCPKPPEGKAVAQTALSGGDTVSVSGEAIKDLPQ